MLRMRAVAVVLTALLSPVVCGLGLGNLKTKSPLNEPFVGRIDIVDADAKDFESMTAKLADTAQFQRAGVARDAVLLGLRFEIVSSERGADYIQITTKDPVREPFLNFLLELNWAKGRLVREYTVLLDPPLYDRNRPARAVMTPAPQAMAPAPVPAPTPARAPAAAAAGSPAASSDTIAVQKNDTAWGLALAHRPDSSVSVQQMILALLRANPDAFANHNVNVLRRGAVLRMPSAAELQGVSQAAAIAEIQHQHQLWEDYRQSAARHVAEAPVAAPPEAPTARAPAADEMPKPAEGPKPDAHLELATPEKGATNPALAPAEGASNRAPSNSPDGSSLANEALDAKTRESADLQGKLTEAEQIIDLLQRQVKIKDEELAKFQAKLGTAAEAPSSPVAAPAPTTATPPAATVPDIDSGPLAGLTNLIPESLRNAVPGGVTTILGILATLAVLIIVGLARALSGGDKAIVASQPKVAAVAASAAAASAAPDPMLSTVQEMATYEPPSGDQDQFLRTMEASADQLAGGPQEDPLEEVNVYLAYERFDQAEELVKKVILDHPQEPKYKLRLLEIYYSANNERAYEHAARELRDEVGEKSPLWESAVAMWTEMSPERALFAPGAVEEPETSIAAAGAKAFVDITSATAATTLALTPGGDSLLASTQISLGNDSLTGATLDFDLSDTTALAGTPSAVLDITAGEAPLEGHLDLTATANEGDLNQMFDLTSSLEATKSSAGDIFDISGEPAAPATLELGQASDLRDVDLLDVTNSGEVTFDNNSLLDVTSPRTGRPAAPDQAEAVTVNAIENRAANDEFDLGDTVAPLAADASARDTGELDFDFDIAALERSVHQASGRSDPDDLDLTLESDLDLSNTDSAKADLDLSLSNLSALDFDLAEPATSGSSDESDVEFDLALQDTTDFDNLSIDDTLELPKSATARRGMQRVDMPSESLEDLTRSMEASIAGLDLSDDHGDDDSILDRALEPLDTDGIDLDFGLDDGLGLNELDTLALDPAELRKASGTISERTVAMPRDYESDLQAALDETDTKLNLAKAYIELGDHEGARSILNEVVADSLGEPQAEARKLLSQLV